MKSQIPLIGKKLYNKNLIAGSEGNISEKKGKQILITPSQVNKSEIKTKDLCIIDMQGNKLKGQASSEKHLHLAIYKTQKKAQAVIHAHPPSAIALSLARPRWKSLPQALPEMILTLGEVPIVPYARPGTKKLGFVLKKYVKKSHVLILAHHGAVVWADSLEKALLMMEQLEQCCKILTLAEAMGSAKTLPKKEIRELLKKHNR